MSPYRSDSNYYTKRVSNDLPFQIAHGAWGPLRTHLTKFTNLILSSEFTSKYDVYLTFEVLGSTITHQSANYLFSQSVLYSQ